MTQHSELPQGDTPAPRLTSEAAEPGTGWWLPPQAAGLGRGLGARPLGGAGPTAWWPWVSYLSSLSPHLLLANADQATYWTPSRATVGNSTCPGEARCARCLAPRKHCECELPFLRCELPFSHLEVPGGPVRVTPPPSLSFLILSYCVFGLS